MLMRNYLDSWSGHGDQTCRRPLWKSVPFQVKKIDGGRDPRSLWGPFEARRISTNFPDELCAGDIARKAPVQLAWQLGALDHNFRVPSHPLPAGKGNQTFTIVQMAEKITGHLLNRKKIMYCREEKHYCTTRESLIMSSAPSSSAIDKSQRKRSLQVYFGQHTCADVAVETMLHDKDTLRIRDFCSGKECRLKSY